MKIALIGNMNNNNFAMMRYFRDLGADAYLLLYANDGQGSLSHFRPECDTWEIEKWRPYIHQTNIPNAVVAALEFPFSWLLAGRGMIRSWLRLQDGWVSPITRKQIEVAYGGYDVLIASGITPATLERISYKLDIFYPYASGVEFLGAGEFTSRFKGANLIRNVVLNEIVDRQIRGIQRSNHTITMGLSLSGSILKNINVIPRPLALPMVYNKQHLADFAPTIYLGRIASRIAAASLSVLHHARIMWLNSGKFSDVDWRLESKNTHWLIHAFANLVAARPVLNPVLLIVEYGPDVEATRQLAQKLGISDSIEWLPKMDRRELMWLLSRVSIGCGEYYDVPKMIWGGTGWEALASGRPLLQGFNFDPGEFELIYGYPPPPMLPVRNQEDILAHLLDMADHPEKCEEIGRGAKEWFNRYNGIGLAKQWLDLLMAPRDGDTKKATAKQGVHG